eukprot:TRINITY_DN7456_c0_g1_i1.p1 TRINITY_DN7456_c0_g1~~TRINITY_DN7456_c0_g1_i1.p1  ORF type:complete len:838 (+),score=128.21 TRINITY_DN7456_c0_g1_i1:231-2516(+)
MAHCENNDSEDVEMVDDSANVSMPRDLLSTQTISRVALQLEGQQNTIRRVEADDCVDCEENWSVDPAEDHNVTGAVPGDHCDIGGAISATKAEDVGTMLDEQSIPFARHRSAGCARPRHSRIWQELADSSGRLEPTEEERIRGVYIDRVYEFWDPISQTTEIVNVSEDAIHWRRPSIRGTRPLVDLDGSTSNYSSAASTPRRSASPPRLSEVASTPSRTPSTPRRSEAASTPSRTPSTPRRSEVGSKPSRTASPPRRSEVASTPARTASPPPRSEGNASSSGRQPSGSRTSSKDSNASDAGSRYSPRKHEPESNMEVVTDWAVLVGKMLHIHGAYARRTSHAQVQGTAVVLTSVKGRAQDICKRTLRLAATVAKEKADVFDSEWCSDGMLVNLFGSEYVDALIILARATKKLVAAQPPLVEATSPCKVFGDIHGQFRDVMLLFHAFGAPNKDSSPNFVFNGDFVDRGAHQLEVLGMLFAFKLAYPDKVWLIRGNHEDRNMNQIYGFEGECVRRLGKFSTAILDDVEKVFEQLPIACCIDQKVLVVHGGLGNGKWKLSDVKTIRRPLNSEAFNKTKNGWIVDIMWSDPIEDGDNNEGVFGAHRSPRGEFASQFAWDVTKTFCARNGISLIIRSHQSKTGSVGFEVMHDHMVMRVFSARDYEGHGNDGAVLHITPWSDTSGMLRVRPQVLRSTTKLRLARRKAKERRPSLSEKPVGRRTSLPEKPMGRQTSLTEIKRRRPSLTVSTGAAAARAANAQLRRNSV